CVCFYEFVLCVFGVVFFCVVVVCVGGLVAVWWLVVVFFGFRLSFGVGLWFCGCCFFVRGCGFRLFFCYPRSGCICFW
ncbi:hypothetical protein, partial [Pseudomonas syringae group genomosp. 7]|uniref:hypothetical protein n=1 Tax=Pseudomonas syringae group genomosp. 7 TaxID=251699 RepID=UPI00376FE0D1